MEQITEQIKKLENSIKIDPQNLTKHFELGSIYIKIKKYDLALEIFNKTIEIDKNFLPGYNNLGNIYKELKKIEKSIKYFKKAIKINSNYINAIYNLAVVYSEIGNNEDAVNYFKKALQINPNHIPTLNNFGILLKNFKKYEEAINCFEKIISIDANFLKAYNNIGTISLELGDMKKAIEAYYKAFNLDPNNFTAYKNLLAAYENSNQIESYEKILDLSKKKFPQETTLDFYNAVLLFRKKRYKDAIILLKKNSFGDDLEIKRNFFLAKSYDLTNQIDSAFKYFSKTNELTKNSLEAKKFDKNRYLNIIKERKKYFTEKNIKKWKTVKYPNNNFNPIFLVGFPRSGTTLLEAILASHPKIKTIDEKPMVSKMLEKIKNNKLNSLEKISNSEIKFLQNQYLADLKKHVVFKNESNLYIDKLPLNLINVGEIVRIFPKSKFILAIRHPLDCVLSCFMQNFNLNDAMSNFLNIEDAAKLYLQTMGLWHQYTSVLNIKHIEIKYEDLINNLESNIKEIIKFLNLDWDDSLLNYRNTAIKREKISTPSYYQVIQPIYKHADQRWKRYNKYLVNIETVLSDVIKKYKYQKFK